MDSGKIIKGPTDVGHAYGYEHRRLERAARELDLTQKQFNDYVNAHPEYFRLENMSRNRGHYDEKQGNTVSKELIDDMRKFLEQGE